MTDNPDTPRGSTPRGLAIAGALITGLAGISMAIYSVIGGEATGAGALLAASALAFGLLALGLDRVSRQSASTHAVARTETPGSGEPDVAVAVQPALAPGAEAVDLPLNASRVNGSLAVGAQQAEALEIDAQPITEREREVLSLVAEGCSNKLIGAKLGISERTVKNHLTLTMNKLRAADRTHAVVTAVRLGWLDIGRIPPPSGSVDSSRSDGDRRGARRASGNAPQRGQ